MIIAAIFIKGAGNFVVVDENYGNHGLIHDFCGWYLIQTRIEVNTVLPVTAICEGKACALYYSCLYLFQATQVEE